MNKRRGLKLIRVNRFARECEIFVYGITESVWKVLEISS